MENEQRPEGEREKEPDQEGIEEPVEDLDAPAAAQSDVAGGLTPGGPSGRAGCLELDPAARLEDRPG